jgi:hypothetical protein
MQYYHDIYRRSAEERIHRAHRAADLERQARQARIASDRPQSSFRRSIGHSIIRIGERLAAEPNLRPARFR